MTTTTLHFRVRDTCSGALKFIPRFFRPHKTPPSRGTQSERGIMPSCDALIPYQSQSLPPQLDLSPFNDPNAPPERFVDAVQNLKKYLPSECGFLGQGDLKIIGPHPIDAGGFADVWVGEWNGTTVAVKSFRPYTSTNFLTIYSKLYREALACNFLDDGNQGFVSFIGVYSTLEHPFCLVFEFMGGRNLREHLRSNPDVGKLDLLLQIACGLKTIHSRGLVHGNLTTANVLVGGDGHPRIAGLGAASIPPPVPMEDIERYSHAVLAPEFIEPLRWRLAEAGPTTASDVFAFAFVAWEVFGGKSPFFGRSVFAGVHSILTGSRPDRPDSPEISDRTWKMIQKCWEGSPAERMSLTEVIAVLESEKNAHRSK